MSLAYEYIAVIPTTDGKTLRMKAKTIKKAKELIRDSVILAPDYYVLPASILELEACKESFVWFFHPNGNEWKYTPRIV